MTADRAAELLADLVRAGVGEEVGRRLVVFAELVGRYQRVTNLRGRGGVNELLSAMLGALVGAPFLRSVGKFVDVGSGNGLPAVPLLVACPGLHGVLLEPRERRWAFLCEVVRELGLAAEVRRERVGEHRQGPYDALTCRGVAGREWVGAVGKLLRPGGMVLWWTGIKGVEWELGDPVLPSPLSTPGGGRLYVWRRRFT